MILIYRNRENSGHAGEGIKSLKRATAIIGMAPDINENEWDHREVQRYGLGTGDNLVSLFLRMM